ncbi:MAG: RNA polymerase factor sigma-32 [Candidatus Binatia bacterium]
MVSEKKDPQDKTLDEIDLSGEVDLSGEKDSSRKALVPFDPLQRYLAEIRRYPLLSREEEHRLAVEYKEFGNIEAAYKLVTSNLRLVVMIAREYQKALRNLLDLIQEGNIGLMEAVKKFDPYRGIRFPSYAVWWVRAYMIRYIMNDWRMVKIGTTQAQRKLYFNLQKEKEKLETEGFTPGPRLLAQRLNVKESEVVEMEQRLSNRDLSTDVPFGGDEEVTLLHFLADDKQTPEERFAETEYRQLLSEKMEQFAGGLKDKELVIFRERLLNEEPLTLREIGERYGISRERVRQIEERVKKKLKAYLGKEFKDVKDAVAGAS